MPSRNTSEISESPNVLRERIIAKPRRAIELSLKRYGDLLLDLFGRQAGRLCDDLGGCIGDVGVGLDRKLSPRIVAVDGGKDADQRYDQALANGQPDKPINHRAALRL